MLRKPAVGWAKLGALSAWIGGALPPRQPSVLVVSLPGSGSSWTGETLGQASNALYLREPLTQPHLNNGGHEAVLPVDEQTAPVYHGYIADAFAALPRFSAKIVIFPEQWGLAQRQRRRLVVKCVNPLACRWLVRHYDLRVIFLVRHPAAVAGRARRLGYWPGPGLDVWEEQGRFQADTLYRALESLQGHGATTFVRYEDLCAEPEGQFRALFEFAGLDWDAQTEMYIRGHTQGGDRSLPYDVSRDSRSMIDAWRQDVTADEALRLEAGYRTRALPWYQAAEEW